MKKFGIILGVGIAMLMLVGHVKSYCDADKRNAAVVNNDGKEAIVDPAGSAEGLMSKEDY